MKWFSVLFVALTLAIAAPVAARPSQETAIDVWGVVSPDAAYAPWGPPDPAAPPDTYFAARFIGTGDDWCSAWLDARTQAIAAGWDAESVFVWGATDRITDTCARTHDAVAPAVFKIDIYLR